MSGSTYEWKPQDHVNMVVRTYLAAGADLIWPGVTRRRSPIWFRPAIIAQLDRVSPNQLWPLQSEEADRACVIEGKRYCLVDDQGMAWVVSKNAANSQGAIKMFSILFMEQ